MMLETVPKKEVQKELISAHGKKSEKLAEVDCKLMRLESKVERLKAKDLTCSITEQVILNFYKKRRDLVFDLSAIQGALESKAQNDPIL